MSEIQRDPGIAPATRFVVENGGHRHRELRDLRLFDTCFGKGRRRTRVVIDWGRVARFRKRCLGGERLAFLAGANKVRPYALNVPPELRFPRDARRPVFRARHRDALGWVITAQAVLHAPALLATHESMATLLGVSLRTAGDTMRELDELGLVRRVPLYRPPGVKQRRLPVAYAVGELVAKIFGLRIRSGNLPGNHKSDSSQKKNPSERARRARKGRIGFAEDLSPASPEPVSTVAPSADESTPSSAVASPAVCSDPEAVNQPAATKTAAPAYGLTSQILERAAIAEREVDRLRRENASLREARDRERRADTPASRFACAYAERFAAAGDPAPRSHACPECDELGTGFHSRSSEPPN